MNEEPVDESLYEEFLAKNKIDMNAVNKSAGGTASKYTEEEQEAISVLNAVSWPKNLICFSASSNTHLL